MPGRRSQWMRPEAFSAGRWDAKGFDPNKIRRSAFPYAIGNNRSGSDDDRVAVHPLGRKSYFAMQHSRESLIFSSSVLNAMFNWEVYSERSKLSTLPASHAVFLDVSVVRTVDKGTPPAARTDHGSQRATCRSPIASELVGHPTAGHPATSHGYSIAVQRASSGERGVPVARSRQIISWLSNCAGTGRQASRLEGRQA